VQVVPDGAQSAAVRHATQSPVAVLHSGVNRVPLQSVFTVHLATHSFAGPQVGKPSVAWQSVFWLQLRTQTLFALQVGSPAGQSLFIVHCTQRPDVPPVHLDVVRLPLDVPEQSASLRHSTHTLLNV
jgi:hypothetical protein